MKRSFLLFPILLGCCVALLALRNQQVDCSAWADHPGAVPAGYVAQCVGKPPPAPSRETQSSAAPRLPGDTATAHDLLADVLVNHPVGDLSTQVVVGNSTDEIYAYDFDRQGELLYALRNTDHAFGISINGTFATIGTATPVTGHTWTGLAVDPVDGAFYAVSTDVTNSAIYSIDPTTGAATLLFTTTVAPALIDFSMNCEGEVYGHDIVLDSIVRIDLTGQSVFPLEPHGFNANFAQGMDFDNSDDKLYVYAWVSGTTYATVNLATGALNPLNTVDGEYEGAIPTTCPLLDFFIGDEPAP